MRKLIFLATILSISLCNSQAFTGAGDNKFQIGVNLQDNANGLNLSYDFGLVENISIGISSTYALGVVESINADFSDRFDIKARFNANIGNVVSNNKNFDIYPGLSLSLKNLGVHLGTRYFFTDGFGVYSEINTPLARYNMDTLTAAEKLHNQFTFSIGAAFNL